MSGAWTDFTKGVIEMANKYDKTFILISSK